MELKRHHDIHIYGIGIDTASMDVGKSKVFKVHRIFSKENVYGIENMKDLHVSEVKHSILPIINTKHSIIRRMPGLNLI